MRRKRRRKQNNVLSTWQLYPRHIMRLLSEMSSSSIPSKDIFSSFFGFQQDMRKEKNQPRKLIRQVQGTNCLCNHYPHDVFAFFWALCDNTFYHFRIFVAILSSFSLWTTNSFPFCQGPDRLMATTKLCLTFYEKFRERLDFTQWWKFWQVTSHRTWIFQDHLRMPLQIKIVRIVIKLGKNR